MPKTRAYLVVLHPSKILPATDGGFSAYATSFSLVGPPPPQKVIRTDSFDDLFVQIQAFADESGVPVYDMEDQGTPAWKASVRVADGDGKPNGFDKATSGMKTLFVPAVVAERIRVARSLLADG